MKNKIKVIYLSGPITDGMKNPKRSAMLKNVLKAIGIGITLINKGYAPIIPHLDWLFGWHPRGKDMTWRQFLDWDLAVIERCDAIYRIPGKSKGADIETLFAKRRGIPVITNIKKLKTYRR